MKKFPSVDVIVLNTNGGKHIFDCLDSLKKTKYPNFRVNVVDQSSTDGSPERIKKEYPWVNLIRNKKNNGFVGGNNQILRKTKAKYSILLNDDTIQEPLWIRKLIEVAENDKDIAFLQPKVRSLRNKEFFEYAGAAGGYMDIYGYTMCQGRIFFELEKDNGQYDKKRQIFWASGVAICIKNSVLKKIGYLDEDFFIYYEETDLCWRANIAGYKCLYVPASVIYHLGSATMGDLKKKVTFRKAFLIHRNAWITLFKNYSTKHLFRIIWFKLLLEIMAIGRYLLTEPKRGFAIISANFLILFNLKSLIKKHNEVQKMRKVSDDEIRKMMVTKSTVWGYFIRGKKSFYDYVGSIEGYRSLEYNKF